MIDLRVKRPHQWRCRQGDRSIACVVALLCTSLSCGLTDAEVAHLSVPYNCTSQRTRRSPIFSRELLVTRIKRNASAAAKDRENDHVCPPLALTLRARCSHSIAAVAGL